MKRLTILLALLMLCVPAWAQRGGSTTLERMIMPDCDTTPPSGTCPSDNYVCWSTSDTSIYRCNSGSTWTASTQLA